MLRELSGTFCYRDITYVAIQALRQSEGYQVSKHVLI